MTQTEIDATPVAPPAPGPHRRPPTLVIASFYLWWPLVIAQSVMLAYLGLTLVQAARLGGPAWDVLFVDPPIAISLLTLITLEIAFAFSLRRGSRVARAVLLVLTAITVAFAFLVGIPDNGTRMPVVQTTAEVLAASAPVDLSLVLKVLTGTALVASVLPFIPPANRYFWRPPQAPAARVDSEPRGQNSTPRRRGRMPAQVLIAFVLWWPIILLEALVVFLVVRQMMYYIGLDMASMVTLLFAVGVVLPLLGILAAESALVLLLRRGSRVARRWLLYLGIPTALMAIWLGFAALVGDVVPAEDSISLGGMSGVYGLAGIIAIVILAASILPYVPPGNRFFDVPPLADASTRASVAAAPGTHVADEPAPPPADADTSQRPPS